MLCYIVGQVKNIVVWVARIYVTVAFLLGKFLVILLKFVENVEKTQNAFLNIFIGPLRPFVKTIQFQPINFVRFHRNQ